MYCITARKLYFISQTLVHCSCRKDFFVRHLYNYLLVISAQNCSAWTKLVLALLSISSITLHFSALLSTELQYLETLLPM